MTSLLVIRCEYIVLLTIDCCRTIAVNFTLSCSFFVWWLCFFDQKSVVSNHWDSSVSLSPTLLISSKINLNLSGTRSRVDPGIFDIFLFMLYPFTASHSWIKTFHLKLRSLSKQQWTVFYWYWYFDNFVKDLLRKEKRANLKSDFKDVLLLKHGKFCPGFIMYCDTQDIHQYLFGVCRQTFWFLLDLDFFKFFARPVALFVITLLFSSELAFCPSIWCQRTVLRFGTS